MARLCDGRRQRQKLRLFVMQGGCFIARDQVTIEFSREHLPWYLNIVLIPISILGCIFVFDLVQTITETSSQNQDFYAKINMETYKLN